MKSLFIFHLSTNQKFVFKTCEMCVRLYTVIYIQLIWLAIFDNFTSMHKQLRTFQISIHGVPIKQNILKIFSNPNPPHHLACPGVGFPFPWRHLLHWGGCVRVSASLPSHPLHTSTTPHINHSQILPPPQSYLNHSPSTPQSYLLFKYTLSEPHLSCNHASYTLSNKTTPCTFFLY